jgi:RNA polymerase sigma-70 factor (ECF subfamily)
MDQTRTSLLIRIRDPRDTQAWAEFHELYAPLLYAFARARGLKHADAEDVRSSCYEAIVRQIKDFEYDKDRGGFKAWLRTLVQRRVVDLLRKHREETAESQDLAAAADRQPEPEELWEQHWREQHLRYCLERVRAQVSESTFAAFRMLTQDDCSVPDVCDRLSMNANQVYKAKSRVLELVRAEMAAIYSEISP